jgi:hypothetical protein
MTWQNPFDQEFEGAKSGDEKSKPFPPMVAGKTIASVHKALPLPVIHGLLSVGEKGELAGGTKSFKTFSLIDLGLSTSLGERWWGLPTSNSEVVYLNFEIPEPFFEARVRSIADAREFQIPDSFHVWHLRGQKLHDPGRWAEFLTELKIRCSAMHSPFLLSDPIYKLLGGRNENSAGDVHMLMEQLEDMVRSVNGSNFFGHHQTKGDQSEKDVIDRSAGSGVFQRDPDTFLSMSSHDEAGAFSIFPIVRNHPPMKDFVVRWKYPLFVRDDELDPENLKKRTARGPKPKYHASQLWTYLGNECLTTIKFAKKVRDETGMSSSVFYELLAKAEKDKMIIKDGIANTWERCPGYHPYS